MSQPHPLVSLAGISAQGCGILFLPFAVALAVSAFFDVSEVTETGGALTLVALVFILPPLALQLLAIVVKVGRERRMLVASGRLRLDSVLATVHRHMRIVTPRGWGALFTGLCFVALALTAKWASLGLLAVLSLLLFYLVLGLSSFVATFMVRSFRAGLGRGRAGISRELSPAVVLAGEPAEERFVLSHVPVTPGFNLLIEDPNVPELCTESRYAVGAGARRAEITLSGRFRSTPRGLYHLGPAEIFYQDLLGFTRVSVASVATATLKVLPRFRQLAIIDPPRSKLDAPDVLTRPHRYATEDPFAFKDYHPGDDTRRIHWRLSIRTGQLQLRVPETREVSTRQVLLLLDNYLSPGRMLADAIGLGKVLDHLVETWISLAAELVERGDRVTLLACVDDGEGGLRMETVAGHGSRRRWQDLGARARWQAQVDLPQLLDALDGAEHSHGVAVSSRFAPPPAQALSERSFTWVYLPPLQALGDSEPSFLHQCLVGNRCLVGNSCLVGNRSGRNTLARLVVLPGPVGSDENRLMNQLRDLWRLGVAHGSRRRLRLMAQRQGAATLAALSSRGDTVYRLEPDVAGGHRLVGITAGTPAQRTSGRVS